MAVNDDRIGRSTIRARLWSSFAARWQLWAILALPLAYIVVFKYVPLYGSQIAFRRYSAAQGLAESPWVGLENFARFVNAHNFVRIVGNTLALNFYEIVAGFPFPILLAVSLNEIRNERLRKISQTVTYMPHFISTVVMVSMIVRILDPRIGSAAVVLNSIGIEYENIMGKAEYFRSIYVASEIWQHTGYGCIVYLAVLAAVDPNLHEAAIVDGATRFQRVVHIDVPSLVPTAVILLILRVGRMMSVGFEKVYLLQNPLNLRTSEVITTYVYKVGLIQADFAFSTAVDLFNSTINLVLLVFVNHLAGRLSEVSLW